MKILDILSGTKVLEVAHSKYNGEIKVIKDFTWGTYIKADNFTQSGGIVSKIWESTLKHVLIVKPQINSCLILGLGGGTVAKLVAQYWIEAKITGVDIDKKMVDLGKRYLGLADISIDIKITDAYKFDDNKFDIIIIDLYVGDKFPRKFADEKFLVKIKNMLNKDAVAIFNRVKNAGNDKETEKFKTKLEKVFKKVQYLYPQANIEYICYN